MYSKWARAATLLCVLLAISCGSVVPWRNEPVGDEVNVAFTIENNLLFLSMATIDGRPGRFFFGSAQSHSVIDPRFGGASSHVLALNERESLRFSPVSLDLGGAGDAIIGADVWGDKAVTIDYHAGLLTYQKSGIHPDLMSIFSFAGEPSVLVTVNGGEMTAVVDTALPDTLVLPSGSASGRGSARVAIAGTNFGDVNVRFANTPRARIGNRLLSRFLVTIDYGKHQVGLWRDPRIPL